MANYKIEEVEGIGPVTGEKLAQRRADNLTQKMEEVNAAKNLSRRTPTQKEVEGWIEQAGQLPRVLEY
jgi:hypothetical protein